MGSAASTLTPQQSAAITHKMKEKIEEYKKAGLNEADMQAKLTADYNHLVHESVTHLNLGSNHGSVKLKKGGDSLSARLNSKNANMHGSASHTKLPSGSTKATGATRRRSFDVNSNAAPVPKKGSAPVRSNSKEVIKPIDQSHIEAAPTPTPASAEPSHGIAEPHIDSTHPSPAHSSPAHTEPPPNADCWDSVSQQPYCAICQMAFKSEAFLKRHINYSDLHINNVKAKQLLEDYKTQGVNLPPSFVDNNINSTPNLNIISKQVEGTHFKLLYTGSKLFWRTQETIELHFYYHILPSTIEIISFDNEKNRELPRIYLDYTRTFDITEKYYTSNPTANSVLWDKNDDNSVRHLMTTFILQRLQLENNLKSLMNDKLSMLPTNNSVVTFVKSSNDNFEKTPVLEKPPVILVPVLITRRRRTNAEEINETINSLNNDRAQLVEATGRAEKIATLVYSSANAIASRKWWADFNPARKRWVWAIRRVIRQKLVAETKKMLEERQKAKDAAQKTQKRTSILHKEI